MDFHALIGEIINLLEQRNSTYIHIPLDDRECHAIKIRDKAYIIAFRESIFDENYILLEKYRCLFDGDPKYRRKLPAILEKIRDYLSAENFKSTGSLDKEFDFEV